MPSIKCCTTLKYSLCQEERLPFALRMVFLNISNVSASNVLKMFLDITVSIGCEAVIFHSYKQTGHMVYNNQIY